MKNIFRKAKNPPAKNDFPLRKTLYAMVTFFVLMVIFNLLRPVFFKPVANPNWGVSFSILYARELGVDPRANLVALLDDMGIRNFRLMSPWSESEKTKGEYDFTDLDWQIDEVAKRGGHVSLAVGLRQPRWPECHAPEWAKADDNWQNDLNNYIAVTVRRYENNPTVTSWQLENEYKNSFFGECRQFGGDNERLSQEFDTIRSYSKKPIYMSLSDQAGLPLRGPTPDAYGVSIYGTFHSEITNSYLNYPRIEWWHRLRSALIQITRHRPTFIHEMQVEPWGPKATRDLSIDEQNKSMSPAKIKSNLDYARRIGPNDIYLWGGEWWYWRMQNGDPSIWDTVKDQINQ